MVYNLVVAGQPLRDFEIQSYLLAGLGRELIHLPLLLQLEWIPSLNDTYGYLLAHVTRIQQQNVSNAIVFSSVNVAARGGFNLITVAFMKIAVVVEGVVVMDSTIPLQLLAFSAYLLSRLLYAPLAKSMAKLAIYFLLLESIQPFLLG